jgi:hypothetical protein
VNETRYRIAFLGLGIALIAVIVVTVLLLPDAEVVELPDAVESVAPGDGDTVLRQTDLVIDMALGYEIEVYIDQALVPLEEFTTVEATGTYTWIPGPGKTFDAWTPGLHSVLIRYERIAGGVDFGELRWVFRVQ